MPCRKEKSVDQCPPPLHAPRLRRPGALGSTCRTQGSVFLRLGAGGTGSIDVTDCPGQGTSTRPASPSTPPQRLWRTSSALTAVKFLTAGPLMGIHNRAGPVCRPGTGADGPGLPPAAFNPWPSWTWSRLAGAALAGERIYGPSLERMWKKLWKMSGYQTVCITSPQYAGTLSNVGAISRSSTPTVENFS